MFKFDFIKNKIDELLKEKESIIIAIDGDSCSGKSTLASLINDYYKNEVNIIHVDDFYLNNKGNIDMNKINTTFDGNIDYLKLNEVINNLVKKDEFIYKTFNCMNQKYSDDIPFKKKKINIVEGSYSLNINKIGYKYYDLSLFLKISEEEQKERLLKRNPSKYEMFISKWVVLEKNYQKHYKIEETADFLINVSEI